MEFLLLAAEEAQSIALNWSGGLIGALAGGGFSAWYGWYVTTRLLPRIIDAHDKRLAAMTVEAAKVRDDYRSDIKAMWNGHREEMRNLAGSFHCHAPNPPPTRRGDRPPT